MPADVKFDAVSGDYYPIIYFNDYWNLQKDYYPINESLATLPLRVSFCPLSLWRWQLYAAQSTKSPWNFLGDELYEQSDEEQDSVKVRWGWVGASQHPPGLQEGKGKWARLAAWGPPASAALTSFTTSQRPPRLQPRLTRGPRSKASVVLLPRPFCVPGRALRVWASLPCSVACFSPTVGPDLASLLAGTVPLSIPWCPHPSLPVSVTRLHGACLGLSSMLGFCCHSISPLHPASLPIVVFLSPHISLGISQPPLRARLCVSASVCAPAPGSPGARSVSRFFWGPKRREGLAS